MDPHTTTFTCDRCQETKTHTSTITTGYGTTPDGKEHCFECCALDDQEYMREHGKITLYLTKRYLNDKGSYQHYLTNWPTTLELRCNHSKDGRHNIAGKRTDVWFKCEGAWWHGVQYGDNTQLCHCKRIKG